MYIAPLEALARQRYADWEARFGQAGLGLKVSLFTVRDLEGICADCVLNSCIIASRMWLCTTPKTLQRTAQQPLSRRCASARPLCSQQVVLEQSSWSTWAILSVVDSGCLPSQPAHCHAMSLVLPAHACGQNLLTAECAAMHH